MAATRPIRSWPGGARVAVQFVINYEEGGENNILHGDAASEAFLSEIVGAPPWPGQRHWNMESIYEYGARAGFWRLHRLFTERGTPGHGLRRRHRAGPRSRAGRRDEGRRLGDRHPRPQMDRIPRHAARTRSARQIAEAIRLHTRGDGRAPARLVHGPLLDEHASARRWRRAASTISPTATPTTCPTGSRRPTRGQTDHPLHARRQRHALRHAAGLQQRRPVLPLPQGQLRHALRRRRAGRAKMCPSACTAA